MRQPCLLASAGRLRNCAGYRGIPMSNQRVPVRGHFIRGSEQTIYRELSRKEERRQQFRYGLRARVAQGDKRVQVRVVCATNRQLQREINSGTFRQDLFYRINVVTIQLPPLRERLMDIPKLAKYFLEKFNRQYNLRARPLSSELLSLMQRHHWPGNIRELENVVRSYVIMGSEQTIYSELLSGKEEPYDYDFSVNGSFSLKALTRKVIIELERKVISQALEAHSWNRRKTARVLNISYRSLFYKIREMGITPKRMPLPQWTGERASDD